MSTFFFFFSFNPLFSPSYHHHQMLTSFCSIPVTLTFEEATGKNVLLLPMGSSTDGAHSINEKLDKRNYIEGIKLLGAYLHYVAEEPQI